MSRMTNGTLSLALSTFTSNKLSKVHIDCVKY
jgi:hypothetical protein